MKNLFRILDDAEEGSISTSHSEFELFLIANDLEIFDTLLLKSNTARIRGVFIEEDNSKNPIIRTEEGEDILFNKNTLLSIGHKPTLKIFTHSKGDELRLSNIKMTNTAVGGNNI